MFSFFFYFPWVNYAAAALRDFSQNHKPEVFILTKNFGIGSDYCFTKSQSMNIPIFLKSLLSYFCNFGAGTKE